jgi:hypothetical protein
VAKGQCSSAGIEKLPGDDATASKHVAAVEGSNKTVNRCICWLFVYIILKMQVQKLKNKNKIPRNIFE